MSQRLKIKQVKSAIGRPDKQRRILNGLGLRGLNKEVTVDNSPSFRGMVKKILHLVEVEETNV